MSDIFSVLCTGYQWRLLPWFYGEPQVPYTIGFRRSKKSILSDSKDMPLSVTVDRANRHDKKPVKGTLDAVIIQKLSHKVV